MTSAAEAKGQKKTAVIRVSGMFCNGCEDTIRAKLRALNGVSGVDVSYNKGTVAVTYAADVANVENISAAINALGYEAQGECAASEFPRTDWKRAAAMIAAIAAVYILLQQFGLLKMLLPPQLGSAAESVDMSYGLIFFVGLATSVHCIAMCGGINLSQCLTIKGANGGGGVVAAAAVAAVKAGGGKAAKAGKGGSVKSGKGGAVNAAGSGKAAGGRASFLWPSVQYNAGRVISYTLLGAAAGAVGSAVTFSLNMRGVLNLVAGMFMIIMGIGMLNIFPQARRFMPKMPKSVSRWVGAGSASNRGPLIVGLLNGFLPCGPLQAMQLFALSTGSPVKGGLAMGLFSLGTVPLMFGLGTFGSFAGRASRRVMTAGAVMVAVLGLCMLSQSWNLFGLPSGGMPLAAVTAPKDSAAVNPVEGGGHLLVKSTLLPYTYPAITVEAGRPVRWEIDAPPMNINGCNNKIFIREYGIAHSFAPGKNVIEFTPTKPGKVPYTCWMGMIPGMITVVAPGQISEQSRAAAGAATNDAAPIQIANAVPAPAKPVERAPLVVNSVLNPRAAYPSITVEAGRPVRWEIEASPFSLNPCNNRIIIPEYRIEYAFKPGINVIEFTPKRVGKVPYSCWMGMIPGMITVVDSVKAGD